VLIQILGLPLLRWYCINIGALHISQYSLKARLEESTLLTFSMFLRKLKYLAKLVYWVLLSVEQIKQ